ncbi:hypothetical protein GVAV_000609 [Gurleya vavrai]
MKKFLFYGIAHFFLLLIFTYKEYLKEPKFYAVLLATTQNNGLHLLHTLFIMYLVFLASKILISLSIGPIRTVEISTVNDHCFLFLTDILLVVTIFSDDLCIQNMIVFTFLIAHKCINWIATERIKQTVNQDTYLLILTILITSSLLSLTSLFSAISKPSLYILFAFEFGIVSLASIRNLFYSFVYEHRNKTNYIFIIDISYIFLRLISVIGFFIFTSLNFRIPFNLFREALSTLKMLHKKINNFIQYKRISKELNKCSDSAGDGQCPICFCDMTLGKKISCGHVFHLDCLKTWVETSEVCPICRRQMFRNNSEIVMNTGTERITGIPIEFDDNE